MGGHIDAEDGSIADAALREAVEESGIEGLSLFSETPISLDRHSAPCSPLARYHLDVQFLAIAPPGAVEHVSPEQIELRWCPFDALAEPTDNAVSAKAGRSGGEAGAGALDGRPLRELCRFRLPAIREGRDRGTVGNCQIDC